MRKLIVGNWKMNGSRDFAQTLAVQLRRDARTESPGARMILCPPFPLLGVVADVVAGSAIELGAQDCSPDPDGAHTGDVSVTMLRDWGCQSVIIGHSERRQDHGESNSLVAKKIAAAQSAGLMPILCVGEPLAIRDDRQETTYVANQLTQSLAPIDPAKPLAVAYEPIWAIGTGRTADIEDITAMHRAIHGILLKLGFQAGAIPILYGGSVKAGNAPEILRAERVGGVLVGGASLEAAGFTAIYRAAAG